MPAAPASFTRRRNYILNLAVAVAGGALLYVTVRRVGWTDVQSSVTAIGWWYTLILLLGGLRFGARSAAWTLCARPERLSLALAFRATLAADALGNLTPLGLLASEPAKVFFVRGQLPVVRAVASVAAENAFYMASVLAMITAGALAFVQAATMPPGLERAVETILGGAGIASVIAIWAARRRPAVLTRLAKLVSAVMGSARSSVERLREIEIHFYALLLWPWTRITRVVAWEAFFHVTAVAEVYLVLQIVSSGATLVQAFILETAGRLIVVVFKFVPYRLGVDEAGTALVARALMLDPAVGVTLALVRRLRILTWNGAGLAVFLLALQFGQRRLGGPGED